MLLLLKSPCRRTDKGGASVPSIRATRSSRSASEEWGIPKTRASPCRRVASFGCRANSSGLLPEVVIARTGGDAGAPGAPEPAPDLAEVQGALGARNDGAGHVLEVEVLMELEPLAGQDEERRLADVQDGVADPLKELRDEEIRDDERRVLIRAREPPEGLEERLAILAVQRGLALARVLRLFDARVGERRDDFVQRGKGHARRSGQVERDRARRQSRRVHRLLGDVHGVVTELFKVQG